MGLHILRLSRILVALVKTFREGFTVFLGNCYPQIHGCDFCLFGQGEYRSPFALNISHKSSVSWNI